MKALANAKNSSKYGRTGRNTTVRALPTPTDGALAKGKENFAFSGQGNLAQMSTRNRVIAGKGPGVGEVPESKIFGNVTSPVSLSERQPRRISEVSKGHEILSSASHSSRSGHGKKGWTALITKKIKSVDKPQPLLRPVAVVSGTSVEQGTSSTAHSCISLLSTLLHDRDQQSLVYGLSGHDAQLLVDYLDMISREASVLQSRERQRALYLLCKLATSAQVFPGCYRLAEFDYDTELVGGGGFSDVYKGRRGDQSVCLKVVRTFGKQDGDHIVKAALQEMTLWAHLSHPNILPFFGVHLLGTTLPRVCFVSPWMENGNLRSYLAKFPETPRTPLISDIIEGLSYLHSLGIVHSDLKAENVLVSDNERALITDFGISSIAASTKLTFVTPNGGTTRWMAPELITGTSEVRATKACDIWSFACLCYEVFTNKSPFYQYMDYQVIVALMNQEVPLRPEPDAQGGYEGVDDQIWHILTKCWNYIPQDRPSCETLRDFIKDVDIRDVQPETVADSEIILGTYRQTISRRLQSEIDYKRVEEILLRVYASAAGPPPVTNSQNDGTLCYGQIISYWGHEVCKYDVFILLISYVVLGFLSNCEGSG